MVWSWCLAGSRPGNRLPPASGWGLQGAWRSAAGLCELRGSDAQERSWLGLPESRRGLSEGRRKLFAIAMLCQERSWKPFIPFIPYSIRCAVQLKRDVKKAAANAKRVPWLPWLLLFGMWRRGCGHLSRDARSDRGGQWLADVGWDPCGRGRRFHFKGTALPCTEDLAEVTQCVANARTLCQSLQDNVAEAKAMDTLVPLV